MRACDAWRDEFRQTARTRLNDADAGGGGVPAWTRQSPEVSAAPNVDYSAQGIEFPTQRTIGSAYTTASRTRGSGGSASGRKEIL
jgi:hypothetical protein